MKILWTGIKHPNFITSDKDNVLFSFSVYCGYRCQNMRTPDIINPTPAVRCLVLAACQINVRPSMQEQILTASSLIYWRLEWLARGRGRPAEGLQQLKRFVHYLQSLARKLGVQQIFTILTKNSTKDEKNWAFGILSFQSSGHCCRINIFVYFYNVRNNWISLSYDAERS